MQTLRDPKIAGATTVQSGATVAGTGSINSLTAENGGTINPGNSPGTLTLTNGMTWNGGGNYNWQIFDANDSSKWDLVDVTGGAFTLNGLSEANKFTVSHRRCPLSLASLLAADPLQPPHFALVDGFSIHRDRHPARAQRDIDGAPAIAQACERHALT